MGVPEVLENVDWVDDEYWRSRKLSPAQLLIQDIRLGGWKPQTGESSHQEPILELTPILSSSLLPELRARGHLSESLNPEDVTSNRQEQAQLKSLANEYGWMNTLRSQGLQKSIEDPKELQKCRWIHLSSKFPEYLEGCLLAFSDWNKNPEAILSSLRQLQHSVYQNERFSKHGRYFSPFFETLGEGLVRDAGTPMLLSVPFLDWSVEGETPPLRFQVDPREGYQSSRSSSHVLRSILQHFYRLEDTSDREHHQVFAKHKPWLTDRELDLKVRRWYGHYPECLNVDELWILVIDARHIITFSSNQTWKSRWPPLQLASRIAEVSFRGIRNAQLLSEEKDDYTAYTHVIACLSGAVGILHRSFWTDIILCLPDRYATHLGHLQYRLHRAPSTRLVMDLLQVQEELNIVIQITQQQIALINSVREVWDAMSAPIVRSQAQSPVLTPATKGISGSQILNHPSRSTFRQLSSSALKDPMAQLAENLKREFDDLIELRDNSNSLVNRTIQLVNIRLEDHGKAILVFTIVTIIFLPLSFVASFFGMNTYDIRNMTSNQGLFWLVSCCLTLATVGFAVFLAFWGGTMIEAFFGWKAGRNKPKKLKPHPRPDRPRTSNAPFRNFEVLDVGRPNKT